MVPIFGPPCRAPPAYYQWCTFTGETSELGTSMAAAIVLLIVGHIVLNSDWSMPAAT